MISTLRAISVKEPIVRRVRQIPAWVIVLATAGVVGSISAMVSVSALARARNGQNALEVSGKVLED